jgi:alpha-tubulin suppressor-like RCC1 family protein
MMTGVYAIALGNFYTCAIEAGGGVKCWGYNGFGQLGIGSTADQTSPVSVPGEWGKLAAARASMYAVNVRERRTLPNVCLCEKHGTKEKNEPYF